MICGNGQANACRPFYHALRRADYGPLSRNSPVSKDVALKLIARGADPQGIAIDLISRGDYEIARLFLQKGYWQWGDVTNNVDGQALDELRYLLNLETSLGRLGRR